MIDCLCGSGKVYKECCEPFHRGKRWAGTAEQLMRSRYCAYALGKVGYIVRTTHPESPHWQEEQVAWRKQLKRFCKDVTFVGLVVMDVQVDKVTFRAVLMRGGQDVSFVEESLFRKWKGRWMYVDAV